VFASPKQKVMQKVVQPSGLTSSKGHYGQKLSFTAMIEGTDPYPVLQQDEDSPSNSFVQKLKEELFSSYTPAQESKGNLGN